MFTDIWTARRSALSLSKNLMVATMVIAIGTQFGVITADDCDGDVATAKDNNVLLVLDLIVRQVRPEGDPGFNPHCDVSSLS